MSSVRSASPTSLHWDSPTRGCAANAAVSRRTRAAYAIEEERSTAAIGSKRYDDNDDDGSEGRGDAFVDLFYMERYLSERADAASAAGCRGGGRKTPAFPQQNAAAFGDGGGHFDPARGDGGGLRRRRNNPDGRLATQEDAEKERR